LVLRVLKVIGNTVFSLLTIGGLVWALQGLNLLPGTFMRGSMMWVGIGAATFVVSLGLLGLMNRRA
jgi:hypothetical protein